MVAGVYSSSKSAATMISETLRLELKPLGVRVITGMIGAVDTPIHQKAGELVLPDKSYYHGVKDIISKVASGELKASSQPAEVTGRKVAGDIVEGKSGRIWRGGFASILGWLTATLLPYPILVAVLSNDKKLGDVKAPKSIQK